MYEYQYKTLAFLERIPSLRKYVIPLMKILLLNGIASFPNSAN